MNGTCCGVMLVQCISFEVTYLLSLSPQTLPSLVYLVQNNDMAVKVDACWALSFLADGQEKQIQVKGTLVAQCH